MKKRTYPSPKMGSCVGLSDEGRFLMISPEYRADYHRKRAAQLEPRKPSPDREAKKPPARLPPKPSVRNSNHLQTPIKNDVNWKRLRPLNQEVTHRESTAAVTNQRFRLFGVDNAIAPCSCESNKTLPGSSSSSILPALASETLDLFPLAPFKDVVDFELSLGSGSGNRKDPGKKTKKNAIQELESDGAPIKNGCNLELSLATGSGNQKAPVKEKKKTGHGLESDLFLCCVHPVAPQRKN